jgi:hypothetical protein
MRIDAGLLWSALGGGIREAINVPRSGQRLSSTDNETSSDSTSNGNHSDMAGFESTVQMRVVVVVDGTVGSHDWLGACGDTILFLAILCASTVRRRVPVDHGHLGGRDVVKQAGWKCVLLWSRVEAGPWQSP